MPMKMEMNCFFDEIGKELCDNKSQAEKVETTKRAAFPMRFSFIFR